MTQARILDLMPPGTGGVHRDDVQRLLAVAYYRGRKDASEASTAEIETLRSAVTGLLEVEDARISTGAFRPNAEGQKRIDAARAAAPALVEGAQQRCAVDNAKAHPKTELNGGGE